MLQYQDANILIVDDNPNNLKLLAQMLRENGYGVRAAIDGETALISVKESPPDLILLDINMPVMDGYEVAHQLKQDETTNEIPIIFISALDDTESIVTAFEHGGVDYISKPFQFAEVDARVQTHLTISLQQKLLISFRERDQERLMQISESEARYRDLFENAHEIIQSVDAQGNFNYVNPQWHRLLGYTEAEVQNMNFVDVIHPDYLDKCMAVFKSLHTETKEVEYIDTVFISKEGREIFVQGNISSYQDAEGFYTRGIFRDLTEQRLAEKEALLTSMDSQRNEVLSNFIRNSSHELRTPLSVIGQQLFFIKRLANDDKVLEKVQIAERKVKDVDNIINQLYQFTTLSVSDAIEMEQVNLSDILYQHLSACEEELGEKNISLNRYIDPNLPRIVGNSELLNTVFGELLANAIRYSSSGDEILVQLSQADDLYVLLTVRDTGIGIAPEHQQQIFDPLFKVNTARTSDGSWAGVGLSMVKRIVELHDGQIQLMSQLDKGSQFNILLPIKQI